MPAVDMTWPIAGTRLVKVMTYPCVMCGKPSVFELDRDKLADWMNGAFIQNVFPELSADDRETLVSGTHGSCFDKLFPEEDQ